MKDDKVKQFLEGLTRLSRKTGIVVEGCGCCGSPWLRHSDKKGIYRFDRLGRWGDDHSDLIFEEKEGENGSHN